jgi:hypoxanthine phosphoribosyltransferase
MIDPTSSWFEIAELPIVKQLRQQTVNGKELLIVDEIFDKTSERISLLVR